MSAILLYFLYIVIVISNLNVAREPNELARLANELDRAEPGLALYGIMCYTQ